MHEYVGYDVIMGPMTDGKQKGDVSGACSIHDAIIYYIDFRKRVEMTQWKWSENGAGVRQVALLTQAALDKLEVVGACSSEHDKLHPS